VSGLSVRWFFNIRGLKFSTVSMASEFVSNPDNVFGVSPSPVMQNILIANLYLATCKVSLCHTPHASTAQSVTHHKHRLHSLSHTTHLNISFMQVYDGHATKTSVLALNSNCEVLEPLMYYFDDNFNMVNLPIQVIIYPHSSLSILIIPHTYPHASSYLSSCTVFRLSRL